MKKLDTRNSRPAEALHPDVYFYRAHGWREMFGKHVAQCLDNFAVESDAGLRARAVVCAIPCPCIKEPVIDVPLDAELDHRTVLIGRIVSTLPTKWR